MAEIETCYPYVLLSNCEVKCILNFSNSMVTVISVYLRWFSEIVSVEEKVSWVIKEQLPHLSVAR